MPCMLGRLDSSWVTNTRDLLWVFEVCIVRENAGSETLSSEQIGDWSSRALIVTTMPSRAPFATRRMVAGNMDSGVGFSGLRQLCWWLDSPCIHQKTYMRHQKAVAVAVTTCLNAAAA